MLDGAPSRRLAAHPTPYIGGTRGLAKIKPVLRPLLDGEPEPRRLLLIAIYRESSSALGHYGTGTAFRTAWLDGAILNGYVAWYHGN